MLTCATLHVNRQWFSEGSAQDLGQAGQEAAVDDGGPQGGKEGREDQAASVLGELVVAACNHNLFLVCWGAAFATVCSKSAHIANLSLHGSSFTSPEVASVQKGMMGAPGGGRPTMEGKVQGDAPVADGLRMKGISVHRVLQPLPQEQPCGGRPTLAEWPDRHTHLCPTLLGVALLRGYCDLANRAYACVRCSLVWNHVPLSGRPSADWLASELDRDALPTSRKERDGDWQLARPSAQGEGSQAADHRCPQQRHQPPADTCLVREGLQAAKSQ